METPRTLFVTATLPEARGILNGVSSLGQARFRPIRSHLMAELPGFGGGQDCWVVTGMGPQAASRGVEEALKLNGSFDQVVGFGVAGGLSPKSRTGDLLIPSQIDFEGVSYVPTPRLVKEFAQVAMTRFWTKGITMERVVRSPRAKQELFGNLGVDFVDMESGAWGKVCQNLGVEWCVVRSVLDGPDELLSRGFEGLSDEFGRSRGFRSAMTLLRNLGEWGDMAKVIRGQMPKAMDSLQKVALAWLNSKPSIR